MVNDMSNLPKLFDDVLASLAPDTTLVYCETCHKVILSISTKDFLQQHNPTVWDKWYYIACKHWAENPTHIIKSNLTDRLHPAKEVFNFTEHWITEMRNQGCPRQGLLDELDRMYPYVMNKKGI